MSNPFNSGPIAPERNPPINPQYYSPRERVIINLTPLAVVPITSITNANPCVIGTSPQFLPTGDLVLITQVNGTTQLNGNIYKILSSNLSSITINVDSTSFGAYISGGEVTDVSLPVGVIVTTAEPTQVFAGQLVRFLIPSYWGANRLNNQTAYVNIVLAPNQFIVDTSPALLSPFGLSSFAPHYPQLPQVVPVGDVNTGPINMGRTNNQTYIDGSFINISPN